MHRCVRLVTAPSRLSLAVPRNVGWRSAGVHASRVRWEGRYLTSSSRSVCGGGGSSGTRGRVRLAVLAVASVGGAVLWTARSQRVHASDISADGAQNGLAGSTVGGNASSGEVVSGERGSRSLVRRLCRALALDSAWEVVMTVLRTGELLVYLVPLVIAYPAVWFGARCPSRGGETAGALWWYRLLRAQMSRAGPTFVKLSQWAASRTDLFSAQFCLELGRLHDSNRAHAPQASRAAVAEAFGVNSIDEVLESFDDTPLGAGAVAQVHRARLMPGLVGAPSWLQGSVDVAIKVLHPGVERQIRRDLRVMGWCAWMLSVLPGMKWLSIPEEVAVFSEMMCAQLDLRIEARNLARFAENFADRTGVAFPRVCLPLDSPRVLVESFCDAVPLRALLDTSGSTSFDRDLGARGLDAFLHMLIYDNFVHADLHPGNIMIAFSPPFVGTPLDRFVEDFYDMSPFNRAQRLREKQLPTPAQVHSHIRGILSNHDVGAITRAQMDADLHMYTDLLYRSGFTASLVFLDCGLVTSLGDASQHNFIDLFESVCTFDGERAGRLMIDRCMTPELVVDPDVFVLRMQDIIFKVRRVSLQLAKLTFSEIFEPVMRAVRSHHVRLAPDFANIIMAMFVLEGIGRRLDPDSDVLRAALPMLRRWLRDDARNELQFPGSGPSGTRSSSATRSSWNLLRVWLYIEVREYIDRIRSWGYDDSEFFGDFAPFITADSSLA